MKIIKDKYVLAMEYLHAHPEDSMLFHWWTDHPTTACLFSTTECTGCLTQIRARPELSEEQAREYEGPAFGDLVREIAMDRRIPDDGNKVTRKDLNALAERQRQIDALGVRR